MPGCQDVIETRRPGCQDVIETRRPGCQDAKTQGNKDARMPRHKETRMPGDQDTRMPRCLNARCLNAWYPSLLVKTVVFLSQNSGFLVSKQCFSLSQKQWFSLVLGQNSGFTCLKTVVFEWFLCHLGLKQRGLGPSLHIGPAENMRLCFGARVSLCTGKPVKTGPRISGFFKKTRF